jgi:hypothetical protein
MANRLRSSSAKVSFFAFLDMITTVTGVLLLITLLLTFYLNDPQPNPAETARNTVRDRLEQARSKLAANEAELRQNQLQAIALTNRIFVVPDTNHSEKQPVLVVLSATNGWCTRLGQTNAVEFIARSDNADFRRLLESWDPARQRLVFYIRPSAIANFEVCRELAAKRDFDFGYDAAEENRQYLLAIP